MGIYGDLIGQNLSVSKWKYLIDIKVIQSCIKCNTTKYYKTCFKGQLVVSCNKNKLEQQKSTSNKSWKASIYVH